MPTFLSLVSVSSPATSGMQVGMKAAVITVSMPSYKKTDPIVDPDIADRPMSGGWSRG